MAFDFISSSTNHNFNTTAITTNKPTWTVDWDLMIAFYVNADSDLGNITPPAWWTVITSIRWWYNINVQVYAAYKIASWEPSSYTFTSTYGVSGKQLTIWTYRWWFNPIDVVDTSSTVWGYPNTNTTIVPSMTATGDSSAVIYFVASNNPTTVTTTPPTTPAWFTENFDWWSWVSDIWTSFGSMILAWSWATWDLTVTNSITGRDKAGLWFILNPAISANTWFWLFF